MSRYSHSRLECFQDCPRQYFFRYVEKPGIEKTNSIEAFMGSRSHEALEKLYADLGMSRLDPLEEIERHYADCWEREWKDNVRIIRKEYTKDDYFKKGLEAVRRYYRRFHPFNQSTTIGIEYKVNFEIDGRAITGNIDRLCHDGKGTFEIHDYKTSSRPFTQEEADQAPQLALYQLGIQKDFGEVKEVRLVWHFLISDLDVVSRRTPGQLEDLKARVVAQIKAIESEKDYLPNESNFCRWCEFMAVCPAKGHQARVAALPINEYLKEEGVVLVNKYAELEGKKKEVGIAVKEIERQQDLIKQAAIAYCQREKVSKISGVEFALKLNHKAGIKLPTTNDPARSELEAAVRKAGLWDRAAELNAKHLADLLEDGSLDPAVMADLRRFTQSYEKDEVRLVKKREED